MLMIAVGVTGLALAISSGIRLSATDKVSVTANAALLAFPLGLVSEFVALFSLIVENNPRKQRPWWIQ
ncbi:MAG: hypothetical protein NVS9B14_18100 [Candidatus Acidiferrum sp.]